MGSPFCLRIPLRSPADPNWIPIQPNAAACAACCGMLRYTAARCGMLLHAGACSSMLLSSTSSSLGRAHYKILRSLLRPKGCHVFLVSEAAGNGLDPLTMCQVGGRSVTIKKTTTTHIGAPAGSADLSHTLVSCPTVARPRCWLERPAPMYEVNNFPWCTCVEP